MLHIHTHTQKGGGLSISNQDKNYLIIASNMINLKVYTVILEIHYLANGAFLGTKQIIF